MAPARQVFAPCALFAALALAACGGKAGREAEEKLPPQVSLYGVRLQSWQGNDLTATGRAAKLTYDRTSGNFGAAESMVRFPSPGLGQVEVRAPETAGNLPTRKVDGSGGITAKADNGLRAHTQGASFDGVGQVASGKERVEVEGPGYSVQADGFTFYFATEELIFEGEVASRLGGAGPVIP